ncbi:MAG: rod shape-determining protein MreC [Porticoccaceae bacterium]
MASQKHIFRRGPVSFGGLIFFIVIGLVLIFVSTFTNLLQPAKAFFVDLVSPFYHITDVATAVSDWGEETLMTREELLAERERLEDENLILQRHSLQLASLRAENVRMRQLLSASELVEERVLIAELVGTPPDTETHRLIVDRGRLDDVREGQPVIDASGVFGQVRIAGDENSEIILISDREHAIPVEVLRSGARSIAAGTGSYDVLRLRNVAPTMDIQVGDELVSSGLGQKFPRGYPVGKVISVEEISSSPFLQVAVEPAAGLQTSNQLLLLFSERQQINIFPTSGVITPEPEASEDTAGPSTVEE